MAYYLVAVFLGDKKSSVGAHGEMHGQATGSCGEGNYHSDLSIGL